MKITMFKAADGKLFEKRKDCAEYDAACKRLPMLEKLVADKRATLNQDDRDNFCLYEEDIPKFITDNSAAILKILTGPLTTRKRRAKKDTEAVSVVDEETKAVEV